MRHEPLQYLRRAGIQGVTGSLSIVRDQEDLYLKTQSLSFLPYCTKHTHLVDKITKSKSAPPPASIERVSTRRMQYCLLANHPEVSAKMLTPNLCNYWSCIRWRLGISQWQQWSLLSFSDDNLPSLITKEILLIPLIISCAIWRWIVSCACWRWLWFIRVGKRTRRRRRNLLVLLVFLQEHGTKARRSRWAHPSSLAIPPAPVPVLAFAVPVQKSGYDAMARLRKFKQMKDVLHPDTYEKVEAEIMATICCQTRCDIQYKIWAMT